jgi:hypothetical protein
VRLAPLASIKLLGWFWQAFQAVCGSFRLKYGDKQAILLAHLRTS